MFANLVRRQRTGKPIRIKKLIPLRKTKYKCSVCDDYIYGIIIDIFEDMDVWGFRYHYFLPWIKCHKCQQPLSSVR